MIKGVQSEKRVIKKGQENPWGSITFEPTVEGGNKSIQTRRAFTPDTAWMAKRFSSEPEEQVYELLQEREKLYSLQKTADNKLNQNFQQWSIKPSTRYPASMNPDVKMDMCLEQFNTDMKLKEIL